ncbi:MAG: hypothetical protein ACKVZJ_13390 [Phycisphaerales bacterium]
MVAGISNISAVVPTVLVAAVALGAEPSRPSVPGQGTGVDGLTKIDQGITDAGLLNRSLRMVPIDLRVDDAFQNVYEVSGNPMGLPGTGGGMGRSKHYMRSAGGLYATFPQSDYINTSRGTQPVTPAGVIYWIGQPPQLKPAASPRDNGTDASSNQVPDRRVYSVVRLEDQVGPTAPEPARAAAETPSKTMEDPAYRITLLARLAEAEKARLRDEPTNGL